MTGAALSCDEPLVILLVVMTQGLTSLAGRSRSHLRGAGGAEPTTVMLSRTVLESG